MTAAILALISCDAASAAQAASARRLLRGAGWRLRLRRPGLDVWSCGAPAPPIVEAAPGAVVIGSCWRQGSLQSWFSEPHAGISGRPLAERLVATGWGSYLALLQERGSWRWVLRDPSGALDALTWRRGTLGLVATDIAAAPAGLHPERLGLDWDAITDLLRRPGSLTARSPLQGFETVTPGGLHVIGGDGQAVRLWRPAGLARNWESERAEEALLGAVDLAVSAALPGDGPALIEISGGFDSAVVAGTAARLRPTRGLGAFHLAGDRPEADERAWAEIVRRHAGLGMFAAPLDVPVLCANDFEELAGGARPALNAIDLSRDRLTVQAAEKTAARVLVTGKGGDAVFFQNPTPGILSDLVAARGWRGWFDPLAPHLSRRLRRSVWSVGLEAARALRAPAEEAPSPLLGPRARQAPEGAAHPWLEGLEGLPPGRRHQLRGLVMTQIARGTTRYGRRMDVRHPLLSQPVMEAALSIPIWGLAREGRERGLARDLFADRVPREILERRSKGELSAYYARTVAANLGFLKPWLLDGCLCEAGVLARAELEAALEPDALIQAADPVLILSAAAVEAFVRHWQGRAPDHPPWARSRN